MKEPYNIGDSRNIVVVLRLDYEALKFIAHELPWSDSFTCALRHVLAKVDADLEESHGSG